MTISVEFEGVRHEFPDDFTQDDISAALASAHPLPAQNAGVPAQQPYVRPMLPDAPSPTERFARGMSDPAVGIGQIMYKFLPPGAMNALAQDVNDNGNPSQPSMIPPGTGAPTEAQFNKIVGDSENDYQSRRAAAGQTGTDWWRAGGNVAGSTPLLALASPAGAAETFWGAVGKGALTGAESGLMTPVSQPDNGSFFGNKAGQVASGTAIGGLFGGAFHEIPKIPGAISRGIQWVTDKLPSNQDSAAGRIIGRALSADSITPEALEANRAALGPSANMIDAAGARDPETGVWLGGRNMYRAGDVLANQPGQTQNLAEQILKPRAANAGVDLIKSIQNNLAPGQYYDTFDTLSGKMADDATPLFQSAFKANQSISSPQIDNMLETDAGKEALAYARSRMSNKLSRMAVPDPELTEQLNDLVARGEADPVKGGVASGLKLKTLDLIRQNLGEQWQKMKLAVATGNAKSGEASELGDLYHSFRQALIDNDVTAQAGPNSLKAAGGDYENALKAYAGPAQLQDALEAGRDFIKGDRELTANAFQDMTPGEQNMFRLGAARTIQGSIEDTGTVPQRLKNILNPANKQRSLMQTIFPNFDDFLGDVGRIVRQGRTDRIIGGSDTFARQANQSALLDDLGGSVIDFAKGNVGKGSFALARNFGNWLASPSKAAQDQAGRYLFDPGAFDEGLSALRTTAAPSFWGASGSGQQALRRFFDTAELPAQTMAIGSILGP